MVRAYIGISRLKDKGDSGSNGKRKGIERMGSALRLTVES